jgi:hypothetical protein
MRTFTCRSTFLYDANTHTFNWLSLLLSLCSKSSLHNFFAKNIYEDGHGIRKSREDHAIIVVVGRPSPLLSTRKAISLSLLLILVVVYLS